MRSYADYDFYLESCLSGRTPKIPDSDFDYWSMQASVEIRRYTFGRIDSMEEIPEEVKLCCCEVAEKLYTAENARDGDGMLLQSYGNDGETGTYKADELSESGVRRAVSRIIRKWLSGTGLLYCGVE